MRQRFSFSPRLFCSHPNNPLPKKLLRTALLYPVSRETRLVVLSPSSPPPPPLTSVNYFPSLPLLRLFVPHNWRNYEYCLPDSFVLMVSISLPGLWWTDDSVLHRCTRRLCSILRDCSSLSSSAIWLIVVSRERIFHLLVGRVLFCGEGNSLCVVRTLFFHSSLLLEDRSHPQTHISIHGEKSHCLAFDTGKHWFTQI